MALYREADDAWEDDYDDDLDTEDDDEPTVPCPYCREEILGEAQRCPHCGEYISEEDSPPTRKPWWMYVGVAICLLIVYLWIKRGL